MTNMVLSQVFMIFWPLHQNKSMKCLRFIIYQAKMANPYKTRMHTPFTPSHSLFFSFSFIPQGKLVCCNAVDLLGDEKPPGPSTVTGLK